MPSRRPPSQRDPAYALHRLAGTVGQILPGGKVKNAAPVKAKAPSRPAVATGGASVTVSTTAPASPATGDLWYDTDATC